MAPLVITFGQLKADSEAGGGHEKRSDKGMKQTLRKQGAPQLHTVTLNVASVACMDMARDEMGGFCVICCWAFVFFIRLFG